VYGRELDAFGYRDVENRLRLGKFCGEGGGDVREAEAAGTCNVCVFNRVFDGVTKLGDLEVPEDFMSWESCDVYDNVVTVVKGVY